MSACIKLAQRRVRTRLRASRGPSLFTPAAVEVPLRGPRDAVGLAAAGARCAVARPPENAGAAAMRDARGRLIWTAGVDRLSIEQWDCGAKSEARHGHSSSKVQSGSARPMIEDAAIGPKYRPSSDAGSS